jgi:tetratricopeptide (TPR) repeat protein
VFQTWTPSRKVIQANIWLKSTRIGQLLGDAAGWFRSRKGSPDVWRGMAMFLDNPISADDPRLTAVYENFRQNLLDICSIARHSGASVILSTVGTNLKDCPPFGSRRRTDLSSDELTRWNASFQAGVEKESEGRWLEAMEQYEAAAKIDDRYAELPFRMGRCLAALGRLDEARTKFILARDLDVLRFRADTQINAAIRRAADQLKDANVYLADAEEALATNDAADNGILGDNLLYEHVHFTFEGNYELAKIVMGQIEKALPQLAASRREGPLLSKEQAAQALTFTPWDEYQMMDQMKTMMSRPPFTNQLEHSQRQAAAREKVRKLSQTSGSPRSMHEAYAAYEAAVKETPDDWDLHRRFGLLATQIGRADVAIDHLRLVLEKLPLNTKASIDLANALQKNNQIDEAVAEYQKALEPDADGAMVHCRLGTILSDRGKIDEAIAHFRKAAEIDPQLALPHNNLGNALSDRGQIDEAIAEYQKALELDPEGAMVHYNLGTIFDNRGQIDEAIAHYKKAIEIQPGYAMAHYNLGAILNDRGQTDEAVAHYEKALEIKPDFANAHNNLGIALISRGQIDEAIAHFQKAVETSPGFAMAHNNLGNALSGKGRIDEAIAEFRKAIEIEPRFAMAHDNLGNALSSQGKIDEAIVHFRKTLEIDPGFSDARQNLERLLKPNSK